MCCRQLSLGIEGGVALVEMPPVRWCEEGDHCKEEFFSILSTFVGVCRLSKNSLLTLTENGMPQAFDSVQLPSFFPCF